MNPQRRTGLIIAIAGFFLIALGIFVVFRLLNISLTGGAPEPPPTPEAETKILVAISTHDVIAGTVLIPDDVTFVQIPMEFVPRDTIDNLDNAVGKILKTDIFEGEMILEHNLANPTGETLDIAYILDDAHVLMALPATDLMSREAVIKRGDIVDILVSYQEELKSVGGGEITPEEEAATRQQVTFTAFQRLDITALVVDIIQQDENTAQEEGQERPKPRRDQMVVQAYLIALDPQSALVVKYLKDAGAIFDFVLRAPTSSGQFELTPVTSEFIKELYGLELLP